MFNDPASPWHAILRSDSAIHFQDVRFLLGRNPLLGLPSFRKLVLQTLADTHVIRTLKVDSHPRTSAFGYCYEGETFLETYPGDPLFPPLGSSVEVGAAINVRGT